MAPEQTTGKQPGRCVMGVNVATPGGANALAGRLASSLAPPNQTTAHFFASQAAERVRPTGKLCLNARPPGAVMPVNGHNPDGPAGGSGGAHKSFRAAGC